MDGMEGFLVAWIEILHNGREPTSSDVVAHRKAGQAGKPVPA